jgi:peptidoglycan L-alanyl-D-glutamate endopeptidase CwlK
MQLNQRSLARLLGVEPILIAILKEAIKTSPYEFQIPLDGGVRTALRQRELYNKKLSRCDGYVKMSKHQRKKAVDIFLLFGKKASWDKPSLKKVAHHIKEVAKNTFNVDLECGCDWTNFSDFPHIEMK